MMLCKFFGQIKRPHSFCYLLIVSCRVAQLYSVVSDFSSGSHPTAKQTLLCKQSCLKKMGVFYILICFTFSPILYHSSSPPEEEQISKIIKATRTRQQKCHPYWMFLKLYLKHTVKTKIWNRTIRCNLI